MTEGPEVPGGRRRARLALWIALSVGAVTALLVTVLATSKSADQLQVEARSPLQGKAAPEITGTLLNGGSGHLSNYRGKWVLVNFFASWCIPCQQEQADLVKFENRHQAAGDAIEVHGTIVVWLLVDQAGALIEGGLFGSVFPAALQE